MMRSVLHLRPVSVRRYVSCMLVVMGMLLQPGHASAQQNQQSLPRTFQQQTFRVRHVCDDGTSQDNTKRFPTMFESYKDPSDLNIVGSRDQFIVLSGNFFVANSRNDMVRVEVATCKPERTLTQFDLPKGTYYLASLPPGSYSLSITPEGQGGRKVRVVVADSQDGHEYYAVYDSHGGPNSLRDAFPAARPANTLSSDVQQEIERIKGGRNDPMPPAQPTSARGLNGQTSMTIDNGTEYSLSVFVSGPTVQKIQIAPGQSQTVTLLPGNYEVAASVSNPSVIPFYGKEVFGANMQYAEKFYISSK